MSESLERPSRICHVPHPWDSNHFSIMIMLNVVITTIIFEISSASTSNGIMNKSYVC